MQNSPTIFFRISLLFILMIIIILFILRFRLNPYFKIGLRNTTKRLPQAVSLVIGGVIGTSVIAGALITGDSLNEMVADQSVKALGDIDVAVTSPKFFSQSLFTVINDDPILNKLTDKVAPMIALTGTTRHNESGALENAVNVYGIDNSIYEFGFFHYSGEKIPNIQENECVINSILARNLKVNRGDLITLKLGNTNPSDAFFLTSSDQFHEIELSIKEVSENKGLAGINLLSRNTNVNNLFLRLDVLQRRMGIEGNINTVILSNSGDEFSGVEKGRDVSKRLREILDREIGYIEAGYSVQTDDQSVIITHENVLFDSEDLAPLEKGRINSQLLTYFVDSISHNGSILAYSTITGLDLARDKRFGDFYSEGDSLVLEKIKNDGIIISNWTAMALGAGLHDFLSINYTILDDNYGEHTQSMELRVEAVIELDGKASNKWLMPELPGIKNIDTCGEWDPPFDIDLSALQSRDLDYWDQYRGIPKGYIDLDLAQSIFGNFQGNLTHLRIETMGNHENVLEKLNNTVGINNYGISIKEVKAEHLATGESLWVLTGMFLAFGALVVGAGALLIINIFRNMALDRKREIGILRSQGVKRSNVAVTFFTEGIVYSIASAGIGTAVGVGVGSGIVHALNTIWSRSVESNDIHLYFSYYTLLISFALGLFICIISVIIPVIQVSGMKITDAISRGRTEKSSHGIRFPRTGIILMIIGILLSCFLLNSFNYEIALLGPVLILLGSGLYAHSRKPSHCGILDLTAAIMIFYVIIYGLVNMKGDGGPTVTIFMFNGIILIAAFFLLYRNRFMWFSRKLAGRGAEGMIAVSGMIRQKGVFLSVLSVAFVVFIITALSVIGSYQSANLENQLEGHTGGYDIRVLSSIPFTGDLAKSNFTFLDDTSVTQIRSVGEPGGTCSNMNARFPPQILGVPEDFVENNNIKFADHIYEGVGDRGVWRALSDPSEQHIPVVVDKNTLIWVYNSALGDTFSITGDMGDEWRIKVVGMMDSSILAGMFIMSQENIEKVFPLTAKYSFFLLKTNDDLQAKTDAIEKEMSYYGMDAAVTEDLARYNLDFEASYLRIFQIFLILGVFIGTTGIAVMVYRSASKRKYEIGVLRSIGFSKRRVAFSLVLEASITSLSGIIIGVLGGMSAAYLSFSAWGGTGFVFPVWAVILIPASIYLISVIFSLIPAYLSSKVEPAVSLRAQE